MDAKEREKAENEYKKLAEAAKNHPPVNHPVNYINNSIFLF